jgi:uncharacterized protein (DUF927 family)
MGAIANSFVQTGARQQGYIDFAAVSAAALSSLDLVLSRYLPGGYREGNEYVVRNSTRGDSHAGSFKINRLTGAWSDFATGDAGGDAIDLIAYVRKLAKLEAARELGELLNVSSVNTCSTDLTGNVRSLPLRRSTNAVASPDAAGKPPGSLPPRTQPAADGKPRFVTAGDEGPRVRNDEKRRHIYMRGGMPVRIKIMRKDADPLNVYRVQDTDGQTGWQYKKPEGFESVPYWAGIDPFATSATDPIYWPEGEKDADTLARIGLPAFTFGGVGDGLPGGCAEYVRGRAVVILADNDEAGRKHAEAKAAAIAGVSASIKVVGFPDTQPKGDVSDWLPENSKEALLERVAGSAEWRKPAEGVSSPVPESRVQQEDAPHAQTSPQPAPEFKLPHGYYFSERGLFYRDDDPEKLDLMLASPFDIVAETRDGEGASWGLLLHWIDHDGREHRLAIPRASLAGDGSDARRILLDGGIYVAPNQKARQMFNAFLLQVRSPVRARATQRIGWHSEAFVLPDDCFGGPAGDTHLLQTSTAHEHSFRQAGTLESWQQNVARYAVGNSRLVISLSAAFAGPLIGPCSAESGGVHFRGASSTGKSTALHVGGSAWGGGDVNGFIRSWRATSNGLEGVALGHTDALLCLDELSQLAAREAGEAAYMLANGSGKSRSSRDGSARKPSKWRIMFLSSGEISLADKIAEDGRGRRMAAGQQVRIVDIPADAGAGLGLFESLHGFASAELFARHLRSATQAHHGVAAREYLKRLVPDIQEIRKVVTSVMETFSEQFVPAGADGQVERVAQRFGIIAAGGEIAVQLGILPWPRGEAVAAAGKCFDDWLSVRGGIEPAEAREGIEQVRAFLLANGMARFIPAWEDERESERSSEFDRHSPPRIAQRDVAGYREKVGDGWDFYVTGSAWKDEICRGTDHRRLAATLQAKGFILSAAGAHIGKSVRVPGYGKLRLYHIPARFLEDEDASETRDVA